MKAVVFPQNGSLDAVQLAELDTPVPQENEVLVQIHAVAVNPLDLARVTGGFLVSFIGWLLRSKKSPPGVDIAGRVAAVGSSVKDFKPGDEVFGLISGGGFAEFAVCREKSLVLKPGNISFEQAGATPVAALTALQGLRDKGQIKPGQKVLINGASGGVGTFAVQIAKSFGTEVTAVCSTRNVDTARSIGADQVIDYTQEDFTRSGQRYDLIFDTVATHSISDYLRALNPGGICAIAGAVSPVRLLPLILGGLVVSKTGSKKIGFMGIAKTRRDDLDYLRGLLEDGKIVPVIDKTYPLNQTAEALKYLATKHARGKIVILVEQDHQT